MFSPLCSVNMLEPMARVSFRFLGCLRVCRTVDPTGITLSLVCWAPIVLLADHYTMPFTCTLRSVCVQDPGPCSSPHPRAHFTSGTRAPAASPTSRSSSAYHGSRETPRVSGERDPPTLLEAQITVRDRPIHIFTCQLPLSLSDCPSPYLTAFDVDYLVCRCIAVRQHDAGRILMRFSEPPPFFACSLPNLIFFFYFNVTIMKDTKMICIQFDTESNTLQLKK